MLGFGLSLLAALSRQYEPTAQAPLKIALIHTNMHPGGVETHILNLCTALRTTALAEPHVFLFRDDKNGWGRMLGPLLSTGTAVTRDSIQTSPKAARPLAVNETGFQTLVQQLRGFDVALTFFGGGNDRQVGVEAAKLAGIPVQVQHIAFMTPARAALPLDALELCSDLLFKIQVQRRVPYYLARIDGGLNVTKFRPEIWPPPHERCIKVVGYAGRLVFDKNPMLFLHAAAIVHKRQIQKKSDIGNSSSSNSGGVGDGDCLVRFVITGDGEMRAALESEAEELGIGKGVTLSDGTPVLTWNGMASSDRMPGVLRSYDIFAFPTFCDSFGYVVAEAMATGLPVVSCRACAVPGLVAHGATGRLIPPMQMQDSEAKQRKAARLFADAVEWIVDRPAEARAMGARARAEALRRFSLREFARRHVDLYARLLRQKRGQRQELEQGQEQEQQEETKRGRRCRRESTTLSVDAYENMRRRNSRYENAGTRGFAELKRTKPASGQLHKLMALGCQPASTIMRATLATVGGSAAAVAAAPAAGGGRYDDDGDSCRVLAGDVLLAIGTDAVDPSLGVGQVGSMLQRAVTAEPTQSAKSTSVTFFRPTNSARRRAESDLGSGVRGQLQRLLEAEGGGYTYSVQLPMLDMAPGKKPSLGLRLLPLAASVRVYEGLHDKAIGAMRQGRLEDAINLLLRACTLGMRNSKVMQLLSILHRQHGDEEAAAHYYQRAWDTYEGYSSRPHRLC